MSTPLAQTIQKLSPSAVRPGKKHWESGGQPLIDWLTRTCDTLLARQQRSDARPEARLAWRLLELQGPDLPEPFDALLLEASGTLSHAAEVAELTPLLLPALQTLPPGRAEATLDRFTHRASLAALTGPLPWAADALLLMGEGAASTLQRAASLRMERLDLGCHFNSLPMTPYGLQSLSQRPEPHALLPSLTTLQLTWGLASLDALPEALPDRWRGLLCHEMTLAVKGTFDLWLQGADPIAAVLQALSPADTHKLLNSDGAIPWRWIHHAEPTPDLLQRIALSHDLRSSNATLQATCRSALLRIGAPIIPHLLQTIRDLPATAHRLLAHLIALPPQLDPQHLLDLLPLLTNRSAIDLLAHLLQRLPRQATLTTLLQTWPHAPTTLRGYLAFALLAFHADTPLPEDTLTDLLTDNLRATWTATKALRLALEDLAETPQDRARRIAPALLEPSQLGRTQPVAPTLTEASLREDTTALAAALSRTLTHHAPASAALMEPQLLARAAAHPDGPLVAWSHVLAGTLAPSPRAELIQVYRDAFGDARLAQAARLLLDATADEHLKRTYDAAAYLVEQEQTPLDLDLRLLRTELLTLQDLAVTALARRGEEAAAELTALLPHPKAAVRTGAARALERLALPSTLASLREAYKKERSKNTKEALQIAMDAADPKRAHPLDRAADLGAWTLDDLASPDAQHLLAQLRDLLYLPPTQALRLQAFDLLLRLHLAGSAHIAVSYLLTHAQEHWPEDLRVLPWGFDALDTFKPLLAAFAPPSDDADPLTTVALLRTPRWEEAARSALKRVEHKLRSRKLTPEHADPFLQAILAGWRFCQEHHLPLANLEVRVDGGSKGGSIFTASTSTALDLIDGFGVRISRQSLRHTEITEGPGLRIFRVAVPPRHALRELHALKPRQRLLDLPHDLLDAADRAEPS